MLKSFSKREFIEYGKACKKLASRIVKEKPDTIVIPLMGGLLYTHAVKYMRSKAGENPAFKKFFKNIAKKRIRVFYVPASGAFEVKHPAFKGFRKHDLPRLAVDKALELKREGFKPRKVLLIDEAKSGSSLVGTMKVFFDVLKKLQKEDFEIKLKALVMREAPSKKTKVMKEYRDLIEQGIVHEIPVKKVVTMDSVFYPILFKPIISTSAFSVGRLVGIERKPAEEREPYNKFSKTLEKYFQGKKYSRELNELLKLTQKYRKKNN